MPWLKYINLNWLDWFAIAIFILVVIGEIAYRVRSGKWHSLFFEDVEEITEEKENDEN